LQYDSVGELLSHPAVRAVATDDRIKCTCDDDKGACPKCQCVLADEFLSEGRTQEARELRRLESLAGISDVVEADDDTILEDESHA
jgi:hypothetical protein